MAWLFGLFLLYLLPAFTGGHPWLPDCPVWTSTVGLSALGSAVLGAEADEPAGAPFKPCSRVIPLPFPARRWDALS